MSPAWSALILAAGQGTRMKSRLAKVLHPLLGRPLIRYGIELAQTLIPDRPPVVVVGHGAEQVRATLGDTVEYVEQPQPLGTGHAVAQARALLEGRAEHILVFYADMPLLTATSLRGLMDRHLADRAVLTLLTVIADDPRGFGRIVRDADGKVSAIVEEAVASPEQWQIKELNAGVYCFRSDWLWNHVQRVPASPKGEYYLTDLVGMAVAQGVAVSSYTTRDAAECIGINTRLHLAEASAALRRRINEQWMLAGVTLTDPATTYIEPAVTIDAESVILPNTHLLGQTTIGADCVIGPNTIVRDSRIGHRVGIECSVVEGATVEDDVSIGPFAHLRPGAHLAQGVHMGNFGEVKNAYLGPGVKMGHFGYIGDAQVGRDVNIGAGTITANYDGRRKHRTIIEDHAFIGSDTVLRAPVRVGRGAVTGAGAVVTKDVPPETVVVGVPARVHPTGKVLSAAEEKPSGG